MGDAPSDREPALRFDLVAASLRADSNELKTFLEALAAKLEPALPGRVRVQREGGLFKRERPVRSIHVQLDARLYEVFQAGAAVEARMSHSVGGVILKHEVVRLEDWITELSRHLAHHAESSAQAREALERLVT